MLTRALRLDWIFVAGSGMLGVSIALNALSTHGACTAIFVAVAAVAGGGFASIRTLGRLSWLAWIGLVCILTARTSPTPPHPMPRPDPYSHRKVFTMTIAVGVQGRPADAPVTGEWVSDYKLVGNPTFAEAVRAVSSLIFAYAGTPAFFNIVSEMRDPRLYTRSLMICQGGVTVTYIVIGVVVYYFCGSYVASPALGSAGPTMKKASYGLALPGLLVTTMLVLHVSLRPVISKLWNCPAHTRLAPLEGRLHPPPARLEAPHLQLHDPLGRLARLHLVHHGDRLRNRQRYPRLRRPGLAHRGSPGDRPDVPAVRVHVAVRQLG